MEDLEIEGFVGRQALGSGAAAIELRDVNGAFVHGCRAPEGTGTFLRVEGGTRAVTLMNNDLGKAREAVETGPRVSAAEVFVHGNRPPRG